MDLFIGEPSVNKSANHQCEGTLFKVIWKKNICSFKAQRGNNKGWHFFLFNDKETWPHIISKTWLFSFKSFNSGRKLVHVTGCLFFFFLPKPPFQVFSLADIFYFYFHAKRFACNLPRLRCSFHVGPPWNKRSRLCGGKVMKKGWVWKSHVMQIRQMLQKIWYQTLSIHSTYWFYQSMFFFCQNFLFWFSV